MLGPGFKPAASFLRLELGMCSLQLGRVLAAALLSGRRSTTSAKHPYCRASLRAVESRPNILVRIIYGMIAGVAQRNRG